MTRRDYSRGRAELDRAVLQLAAPRRSLLHSGTVLAVNILNLIRYDVDHSLRDNGPIVLG